MATRVVRQLHHTDRQTKPSLPSPRPDLSTRFISASRNPNDLVATTSLLKMPRTLTAPIDFSMDFLPVEIVTHPSESIRRDEPPPFASTHTDCMDRLMFETDDLT